MTTGHPHAALMAEYAEVAKTNPEPWTEFEVECVGQWIVMQYGDFRAHMTYRRKPKPPKKIKFQAWLDGGQLKYLTNVAAIPGSWKRLPALDLECEVPG